MPVYRKKRKLGRKPSRKRYGRRSYKSNSRRSRASRDDYTGSAFRGGTFGGFASVSPPIVPLLSPSEQIRIANRAGREILAQVKDSVALVSDVHRFSSPLLKSMGAAAGPAIVYGATSLAEFAYANPWLSMGAAGAAYYAYKNTFKSPIVVKTPSHPPPIVGKPVPSTQPTNKSNQPTIEYVLDETANFAKAAAVAAGGYVLYNL